MAAVIALYFYICFPTWAANLIVPILIHIIMPEGKVIETNGMIFENQARFFLDDYIPALVDVSQDTSIGLYD